MTRYTDLDRLLAHIWEEIEQGAEDPSHACHTPTFATEGDRPNLRTVVLRQANSRDRTLLFHSDRRAHKIAEIQTNPKIAWHIWNRQTREQFRLFGEASLHFEDAIAEGLWENSQPKSLKIYVKPIPPNTAIDAPQSGLDPEIASSSLSNLEQVASGRKYFAAIQTTIDEINWLHLHPEGQYRARYQWRGDRFEGNWIIP